MPALVAADVTVVVTERWIEGGKRHTYGTMAFGDGAKTYPTAGVPLPGATTFGFIRNMTNLVIEGISAGPTSAQMPHWDRTGNKLSLFQDVTPAATAPFPEVASSFAPAARTYNWNAIGW